MRAQGDGDDERAGRAYDMGDDCFTESGSSGNESPWWYSESPTNCSASVDDSERATEGLSGSDNFTWESSSESVSGSFLWSQVETLDNVEGYTSTQAGTTSMDTHDRNAETSSSSHHTQGAAERRGELAAAERSVERDDLAARPASRIADLVARGCTEKLKIEDAEQLLVSVRLVHTPPPAAPRTMQPPRSMQPKFSHTI